MATFIIKERRNFALSPIIKNEIKVMIMLSVAMWTRENRNERVSDFERLQGIVCE